jgi:hypothetical protein
MLNDTIFQKTDPFLSVEVYPDNIREHQDIEYNLLLGYEHCKSIRDELFEQVEQDILNLKNAKKNVDKFDDSPITEYEHALNRYSKYCDEPKKHIRVQEKEKGMKMCRREKKDVECILHTLQEAYTFHMKKVNEDFKLLKTKFLIYCAVMGKDEILEELPIM